MVAGESEVCSHAMELLGRGHFDLVIMESRLHGQDSLTCLQQIKLDYPELPVLVFSSYGNPVQMSQANILGAAGFLSKAVTSIEFMDACRKAVEGESLWTSDMLRRVNVSVSSLRLGDQMEVQLTSREIQVLGQLGEGSTNKEIASSLEISYETVKEHVQNVLKKIGVSDRTQAAVWAVRHGLI